MSFLPEIPTWPPAFSVRISLRAKYPRLRILPGKGLEVVLPRNMRPETAITIVERHRDWIDKTLDRVRANQPPTEGEMLPATISLYGGEDLRTVICRGEDASDDNANVVLLNALRDNPTAALQELQAWTRCHASTVLGEETEFLARQHAIPYARLRFRRQKSRWGSCSASGTINLNICLVFLPADLARHVIMHELAHIHNLNHGQGFWKTLFAMEPDAIKQDRRLRAAWRYVPSWIWL